MKREMREIGLILGFISIRVEFISIQVGSILNEYVMSYPSRKWKKKSP